MKRFGRNQRRHMREEIAAKSEMLSEALNRSAARKREADTLRGRLESWAREILNLMGSDSAFNEQVSRRQVDERMAESSRMRLSAMSPIINMRSMQVPPTSVQTVIEALIWRLHLSSDEFRPMVRIELENRFGQPIGYALPPDHRWTERDIEYLSRRIATEMVELLNSGKTKAAA